MSNEQKANFERFFEAQPFHQTLRFTEGNRLFICDVIDGVTTYRNLTVQACWATWQHLGNMEQCYIEKKKEVEEVQEKVSKALNFINNWWHPDLDQKLFVEAVEKALRGTP